MRADLLNQPVRLERTRRRRIYNTNPLVRFPALRGRGPVTKRRRDGREVAPPPIRFHKTNPRPCSVRKAVLQFEPARPVSGFARSQSSATRGRRFTRQTCGVRHDQANAVLAETHASKIFEKSVFRIRSNNDGTRPGYSRSIVTTRWKLLIPFGEILVIARNTHAPRQVEAWRHAEASAPRVSDGSH